jgi:hypothetical protein
MYIFYVPGQEIYLLAWYKWVARDEYERNYCYAGAQACPKNRAIDVCKVYCTSTLKLTGEKEVKVCTKAERMIDGSCMRTLYDHVRLLIMVSLQSN